VLRLKAVSIFELPKIFNGHLIMCSPPDTHFSQWVWLPATIFWWAKFGFLCSSFCFFCFRGKKAETKKLISQDTVNFKTKYKTYFLGKTKKVILKNWRKRPAVAGLQRNYSIISISSSQKALSFYRL